MKQLPQVILDLERAIDEVVAFGRARMSDIKERERRLRKIRNSLKDQYFSGQLELFDSNESTYKQIEVLINDPTRGL